jgi:HD superfamily phosphodiesterase
LFLREKEHYLGSDFKRINHAKAVLDFAKKLMKAEGCDEKVIVPSAK